MKLIKYFVLILLFIVLTIIIRRYFSMSSSIEGFNTMPSYQTCINNGYTKEFCSQTPTSMFGPNTCLCNNGSMGYLLPGFRGRCVCQDDL